MSEFRMMTFEEGGFPEELHNEADCRRAVASGRVDADTEMMVYPHEGEIYHRRAIDAPVLRDLLAPEPEALVTDADEADAESADADAEALATDETAAANDDGDAIQPGLAPDWPSPPPSETPPEPPVQRRRPSPPSLAARPAKPAEADVETVTKLPWNWIVPALVALVIVILVISAQGSPPDLVPMNDTLSAEPIADPSPVDPEAGLPQQTLYAMREVSLQNSAATGEAVTTLPRGAVLHGVIVPGEASAERWLHINEGPQTGLYVWAGNLSSIERPTLDTSTSGLFRIATATFVRASPEAASIAIGGNRANLDAGQRVNVAGIVNNDWAEVTLIKGGVGYIPLADIETVADGDGENATENVAEPAQAQAVPTPRPSPDDRRTNHRIYVRNQCGRTFRFMLYYDSGAGWMGTDGTFWSFPTGHNSYPTLNSDELTAVSAEIYIAEVDSAGRQVNAPGIGRVINFGDRKVVGRRADVTLASDGDYEVRLPCS